MAHRGVARPKVGVVSFPGSNGDDDALIAFRDRLGLPARMVDYRETDLAEFSAIVLPGGFSYGDYLRCGAIARFAPVIEPLRGFASSGRPILGICNGFQVLTEAHLLPGALLRNQTLKFHCHWAHVRIEQSASAWTTEVEVGAVLRLPVAHGDGAFFADDGTLVQLEASGQVVARYVDAAGAITADSNPNGSVRAIAGVANTRGNVVGLMPHPERASDALTGGDDGLRLLRSAFAMLNVAV